MNFGTSISMLDDEKRLTTELSEFGEILAVPHDSNCGYHSICFGLQAIGKKSFIRIN